LKRDIVKICYNKICMFTKRFFIIGILLLLPLLWPLMEFAMGRNAVRQWNIQSIDTMKYSRDLAREKLDDPSFDKEIDAQMTAIEQTGANYVAVGTPYDKEFLPLLKRWVASARAHNLHVWFRGNFSGWEGWFDYPQISRKSHTDKIEQFITDNPDLFADGDMFSSCPECENGGDKVNFSNTKEVSDYRSFLIREYQVTKSAFSRIGKQVGANYYSMNGDVARAVMDPDTTTALDGVVVVDHYVATPEQLATDIQKLAEQSGGKVVLGEFGFPIPDINGAVTDAEQAHWLADAFRLLAQDPNLVGLNYWVDKGGSTALWDESGNAKPGVAALTTYYSGEAVQGVVQDENGKKLASVTVKSGDMSVSTGPSGRFAFPYSPSGMEIQASGAHYLDKTLSIASPSSEVSIVLEKRDESLVGKVVDLCKSLFSSLKN
jgi:hypothetical protein